MAFDKWKKNYGVPSIPMNKGGGIPDLNDPTNRDTIPAMLTEGEYVLNKEATQMFGPQIEAMNEAGLQQRHMENAMVRRNMAGPLALQPGGPVGDLPIHEWDRTWPLKDEKFIIWKGKAYRVKADGTVAKEPFQGNRQQYVMDYYNNEIIANMDPWGQLDAREAQLMAEYKAEGGADIFDDNTGEEVTPLRVRTQLEKEFPELVGKHRVIDQSGRAVDVSAPLGETRTSPTDLYGQQGPGHALLRSKIFQNADPSRKMEILMMKHREGQIDTNTLENLVAGYGLHNEYNALTQNNRSVPRILEEPGDRARWEQEQQIRHDTEQALIDNEITRATEGTDWTDPYGTGAAAQDLAAHEAALAQANAAGGVGALVDPAAGTDQTGLTAPPPPLLGGGTEPPVPYYTQSEAPPAPEDFRQQFNRRYHNLPQGWFAGYDSQTGEYSPHWAGEGMPALAGVEFTRGRKGQRLVDPKTGEEYAAGTKLLNTRTGSHWIYGED